MENKKNILARTYFAYMLLCVFALSIVYRIVIIQFYEGDVWRAKAQASTIKLVEMDALRGNIFDANGALLATSLPYYEVAIDINTPGITDKVFKSNRDSLAYLLSRLFEDKSEREYLSLLNKARKTKDRYVVLKRNVSYKELQTLKTFPILRKGKRGGLVTLQTNRRERPFQGLAGRTIGMARKGIKPVGLEGAFDSVLSGVSGRRLMQKIAGDVWRPINDENEVEPKDGSDLYTTIDINLQDVASSALLRTLVQNNASHGCAILMEVKTGEIKAIANLSRQDSSVYTESFNYAIGYPSEPGSTFKLASMLALIDEYGVSLDEKVDVGNGECRYFDKVVRDAHAPETSVLSVQRIFETSSNVGVSKLITKYYSKNPQQFVDKLNSFRLNQQLGLAIPGEGIPRIPQTRTKYWSGVTLPQLSYGYESLITPLQTLTLYNAVANNGKMVKPRFVKAISRNGRVIKTYGTEVLSEKIVKDQTIVKAKLLLEGVVENGSGKNLNISAFKVGGKTGTAVIAKQGRFGKGKTAYGEAGNRIYQASFVGYFPADHPLYSCIVVINSPSNGVYYGAAVAGPVFKEIAEKVYSGSLNCIEPVNTKKSIITQFPLIGRVQKEELQYVSSYFGIVPSALQQKSTDGENAINESLFLQDTDRITAQLKRGLMPDLMGLSAKDALYILENNGVEVKLTGMGIVKKQSIQAGQKFEKGNSITLTLG